MRNDLKVGNIRKEVGTDFEFIALDLGERRERIVGLYRAPGQQLSQELAELALEEIVLKKAALVVGDLNLDLKCEAPRPKKLTIVKSRNAKSVNPLQKDPLSSESILMFLNI